MLKNICWRLNFNKILTQKISYCYFNLISNMHFNYFFKINFLHKVEILNVIQGQQQCFYLFLYDIYYVALLKIILPLTLHDCGYIPRQMLSSPLAPCTLGDLTISSLEDLEFLCCLLILNRLFTMLPPDLQGHARIWTEPSLSSSELQPLVI